MTFPVFAARLLVAVVLIGCVVVVGLGYLSLQVRDDPRPGPRPTTSPPTEPAGGPVQPRARDRAPRAERPDARGARPSVLVIRSLGIRAPVVPVHVSRRVLPPPADVTTVGWWRDGARPGAARGSAVLVGHTVHTGGGVFDDLDRLRPGARVQVATADGRLRYVVDHVASYSKRYLATHAQRIFDQSVAGRLVLITCGRWNGDTYLSNEVATAHVVRP